jgi:nitroreductase
MERFKGRSNRSGVIKLPSARSSSSVDICFRDSVVFTSSTCWHLPADACVGIFFLADLKRILERYRNRGYWAIQLEAGAIGGRMYLAAYAQRLGATGLTFSDDDVINFFSPHAKGKSVIFLLAVGNPLKRKLQQGVESSAKSEREIVGTAC